MRTVARTDQRTLSARMADLIRSNARLRAQIISIGIPILLPDGRSLLRSAIMKIPPAQGEQALRSTPGMINRWAHDGWVDLRVGNMKLWRSRMRAIMAMVHALPADETGSRSLHTQDYWSEFLDIDPGKVCGWIFTYEEKGKRMKA
jgi:hypothetical protein